MTAPMTDRGDRGDRGDRTAGAGDTPRFGFRSDRHGGRIGSQFGGVGVAWLLVRLTVRRWAVALGVSDGGLAVMTAALFGGLAAIGWQVADRWSPAGAEGTVGHRARRVDAAGGGREPVGRSGSVRGLRRPRCHRAAVAGVPADAPGGAGAGRAGGGASTGDRGARWRRRCGTVGRHRDRGVVGLGPGPCRRAALADRRVRRRRRGDRAPGSGEAADRTTVGGRCG